MAKNFLRTLLLALGATAALGLVAAPAVALVINQGDLIWEADNWQGNIHLKAKYKESPENGLVDQTLEVEIQHVPPFLDLQVQINGYTVGAMTSDAAGHAQLRIDRFNVQPDPQGRPNGVRIETGDVVTVRRGGASISAAFAPVP